MIQSRMDSYATTSVSKLQDKFDHIYLLMGHTILTMPWKWLGLGFDCLMGCLCLVKSYQDFTQFHEVLLVFDA